MMMSPDELDGLVRRLLTGANSALMADAPELRADIRAAAAIVELYAVLMRANEDGAAQRSIERELALLVWLGALIGR
jgi:hypothetical protein